MLNRIMIKLASLSEVFIITIITLVLVIVSIFFVYFLAWIFETQYTIFIFQSSIITPLVISPGVLYMVFKLSKHLLYFKEFLHQEIQKNKHQDLILFEEARYALMGEMMANISHQWKQPLNTIGLAIFSLRTSAKSPEEMEKHFDIMEDNVSHLATTIDDFMSFFDKKTHSEMKDLDAIIKEIKSIIYTHIANQNIELEINLDNTHGDITIASSVSQIILNLLNNAKDALKERVSDKKIRLQLTSTQFGLEIECCDNGSGIDEKIKDKIFDPYFTTKQKKQGTGIGLYMSKEIVYKFFDGKIDVSSRKFSRSSKHPEDNSGKTCFYIAIPYSPNCILEKSDR